MASSIPKIDFDFSLLDSAAIAAVANLIVVWIQTTPADQLARNHARLERAATWFEEDVLKLPPLVVPGKVEAPKK